MKGFKISRAERRAFLLKAANEGQDFLNEEHLETSLVAWVVARKLVSDIVKPWRERGYLLGNAEVLGLQERMLSYGGNDRADERNRLAMALMRDVTGTLDRGVWEECIQFGGNAHVTVEFRGPTGKGKSTAALGVMERIWNLQPASVRRAVYLHKATFIRGVGRLAEGDKDQPRVLLLDEDDVGTGEGSGTDEALVRSKEGRLRQLGISMFFCRAATTGEFTRKFTVEIIGISEKEKACLGLVYQGVNLIGYEVLPWCSLELYQAYSGVKNDGLLVSARGFSPQLPVINATLLEILSDDRLMKRMSAAGWRATLVERILMRTPAGEWAKSMSGALVQELAILGPMWDDDEQKTVLAGEIEWLKESGLAW